MRNHILLFVIVTLVITVVVKGAGFETSCDSVNTCDDPYECVATTNSGMMACCPSGQTPCTMELNTTTYEYAFSCYDASVSTCCSLLFDTTDSIICPAGQCCSSAYARVCAEEGNTCCVNAIVGGQCPSGTGCCGANPCFNQETQKCCCDTRLVCNNDQTCDCDNAVCLDVPPPACTTGNQTLCDSAPEQACCADDRIGNVCYNTTSYNCVEGTSGVYLCPKDSQVCGTFCYTPDYYCCSQSDTLAAWYYQQCNYLRTESEDFFEN